MKKGAKLGPLHGVPFSTKDLVITKGIRTTFGTRLYADNVPAEDAPMVERMKAAGAIMLGKTNTPTFGWIGATHNLLFGITRNPWNLDRTPGGSSRGSAAAVAAGLAPLALGSDGGGSIRIPASFCGIPGLKPTYGLVPRAPEWPGWQTLTHVGPLAFTVADCALMLQVLAGPDPRDPRSLPALGKDYVAAAADDRDTIESYEVYLARYPDGSMAEEDGFCQIRFILCADNHGLIAPAINDTRDMTVIFSRPTFFKMCGR
jgi:aspartyl-tRNA(Asn)/glutamyl-tRNA(Gln) amidotransferase subunit A